MSKNADFYAEHYSNWTVHKIPVIIYIPTLHDNPSEALALVREILDEAAFDIRVSHVEDGSLVIPAAAKLKPGDVIRIIEGGWSLVDEGN